MTRQFQWDQLIVLAFLTFLLGVAVMGWIKSRREAKIIKDMQHIDKLLYDNNSNHWLSAGLEIETIAKEYRDKNVHP